MANGKFEAVYNVFTRQLAVLYGDCVSTYEFEDREEWTKVSYNGNTEHPDYLHVQLDYDECSQLLFYPRKDGDSSLNEEIGTYFYSSDMNDIPENLKITFNDDEYNYEFERLKSMCSKVVEIERGL